MTKETCCQNNEPWRQEYEEGLARIKSLCANEKVMSAICGRLPNTGEDDDDERYQKNVDNALASFSRLTEEDWRI